MKSPQVKTAAKEPCRDNQHNFVQAQAFTAMGLPPKTITIFCTKCGGSYKIDVG